MYISVRMVCANPTGYVTSAYYSFSAHPERAGIITQVATWGARVPAVMPAKLAVKTLVPVGTKNVPAERISRPPLIYSVGEIVIRPGHVYPATTLTMNTCCHKFVFAGLTVNVAGWYSWNIVSAERPQKFIPQTHDNCSRQQPVPWARL